MTDITDLFNKTPLNLKSQLYNELKEYTWYILKDGEFVKNPDYF